MGACVSFLIGARALARGAARIQPIQSSAREDRRGAAAVLSAGETKRRDRMRGISLTTMAAAFLLAGCAGSGGSDNSAADANSISEDPYGATGAPGADLTDNGVTDGANGLADTSEPLNAR